MDEALLQEASQLEQYTAALEENHEYLARQIAELEHFAEGLGRIKKAKEKEILAPLGKGVFMKAEREESKLFVEVGAGVIVKKTPEELEEVIGEQIKRLRESNMQITTQLGLYAQKLQEMMSELEKSSNAETK